MGEKRAYKSRKPGGGRKKLKPKYDAGKNLKEQMDAAVALYEEDCSLQSIANALNKLMFAKEKYAHKWKTKIKTIIHEEYNKFALDSRWSRKLKVLYNILIYF